MKLTVIVATLALAAFAPGRDARAVPYTFTNFDPSGTSTSSGANAVNNAGQVVGFYNGPTGSYGFIYDLTTGATTTLNYPSVTPNSVRTVGTGINDLGQVVGTSGGTTTYGASGFSSFVFGSVSGIYTPIVIPTFQNAGYDVEVSGINNADQIVGSIQLSRSYGRNGYQPYQEGFLSNLDGSAMYDLSLLTYTTVYGFGLNNLGQVVGYITTPAGFNFGGYSFLPVAGESALDRADLVGTYTAVPIGASGINDVGQVVGSASNGTISQGFVFDIASGLSTSLSDPSGVGGTYLTGINNSGEVVGYYLDAQNVSHSFFATPQSTTVPEPATLALLGTALFGVLGRPRRR